MLDKNEIIIHDDYAEIVLLDKFKKERARALIDLENIDIIKEHRWYLTNKGYTVTKVSSKMILLHKLITNTDSFTLIDHKDENKLNCRMYNLRVADKSKNSQNRKPRINNTSGFTGVKWRGKKNKWEVTITSDKTIYLGYYKDLKDSAMIRIKAEYEHFKEFRSPYNEERFKELYGEDEFIRLYKAVNS